MTFSVHTSIKSEELAEHFAHSFFRDRTDPFSPLWCITQTEGIQRWLNLFCAQTNGIMANCKYLFPVRFLQTIATLLGEKQHFIDEILTWNIYKFLPFLEERHPILRTYTQKNPNQPNDIAFRQYQLAIQLTPIFNRYMSYRCHMLHQWQHNETCFSDDPHEAWQAELWTLLLQENPSPIGGAYSILQKAQTQPTQLYQELLQIKEKLPSRIVIFGVSELPEIYMDIFKLLSEIIDIQLYYLTPCLDFWGDTNKRDEEDNFLLAAWGNLGKTFHNALIERDLIDYFDSSTLQPENPHPSLLQQLQASIATRQKISNLIFSHSDQSLQIVSHYSRLREVEGLKDFILKKYQEDPNLRGEDILIISPQISEYVHEIHTVFDYSETKIPYTIADRSQIEMDSVAKVILKLFELAKKSFQVTSLFDFLQMPPVLEHFELTNDDIDKIYSWLSNANIRWGKDRQDIAEHLGITDENLVARCPDVTTWQAGFERLLTSLLLGEAETSEFPHIARIHVAIEDRVLLGKFHKICTTIFDLCKKINQCTYSVFCEKDDASRTASALNWRSLFSEITNSLLSNATSYEQELINAEKSISHLTYRWFHSKIENRIPAVIAECALKQHLAQTSGFGGLLRGKVTFCQFMPMRTIPAKIICMLGMNDGDFPRQDIQLGFDLSVYTHDKNGNLISGGNKTNSITDRYLFLETFMAARTTLYISYLGKDNITNKDKMPSIVIQDLLNTLETAGLHKTDIVTNHPLYAHDLSYFTQIQPQSFSQLNYQVAQVLQNNQRLEGIDWTTHKLSLPQHIEIDLDELLQFYKKPTAFFIKKCLGITGYNFKEKLLEDDEPDELNALDLYQLGQHVLSARTSEDGLNYFKNIGKLPWQDYLQTDSQQLSFYKNLEKFQELRHSRDQFTKIVSKPFSTSKTYEMENVSLTLTAHIDNLYQAEDGSIHLLTFIPKNIKNSHIEKLIPIIQAQFYSDLQSNDPNLPLPDYVTYYGLDESQSEPFEKIQSCYRSYNEFLHYFFIGLRQPLFLISKLIDKPDIPLCYNLFAESFSHIPSIVETREFKMLFGIQRPWNNPGYAETLRAFHLFLANPFQAKETKE